MRSSAVPGTLKLTCGARSQSHRLLLRPADRWTQILRRYSGRCIGSPVDASAALHVPDSLEFASPLSGKRLQRPGTEALAAAVQAAGAAQHATGGRLTRPTGVSKIDLLTVWGGPSTLAAAPGAAARVPTQAAGSQRERKAREHRLHRPPQPLHMECGRLNPLYMECGRGPVDRHAAGQLD